MAAVSNLHQPNAFEQRLINDASERLDRKEVLRRKERKGLKRQWQNGNIGPMTLCKLLAQKDGDHSLVGWLTIFGNLEVRRAKTVGLLAKLRKVLTDKRFPLEPWEVAEEAAKLERARAKARKRSAELRAAKDAEKAAAAAAAGAEPAVVAVVAEPAAVAEPTDSDLELSEEEDQEDQED